MFQDVLSDKPFQFLMPQNNWLLCSESTKMSLSDDCVVSLSDIEVFAHKVLPKNALDYYRSGADKMQTLHENKKAFSR